MKIGFSACALGAGQTGISTYIRELIRYLQLEDSVNQYELLTARNEADLIPLSKPNFNHRLIPDVLNRPVLNLAWHNTALPGISRKYDVLHIPTARRIPLIKGTKVIATVHDLAAFSVDGKYDRARMVFNREWVPAMIRRADHIIAVSNSTKTDLIQNTGYPEKQVSVIYHGIDHDLFQPVDPAEARDRLQVLHGLKKPFMLYVSRLEHPGKNHIRLIEAFERFKLENDSAHQLVLAGAAWRGADIIKARAAESPVKGDILFPGFVPIKSLPLFYSGCDLMIFPSLFEGFGLPIVEALACGAPVTCSNTSSMKELAGDLIPSFSPQSTEEIFRSMEQCILKGYTRENQIRGIEYAKGFDWRKTAESVVKAYSNLLEEVV